MHVAKMLPKINTAGIPYLGTIAVVFYPGRCGITDIYQRFRLCRFGF